MQESLNQLTKDPSYKEYAYIAYDDIKALPSLTNSKSEVLVAIRAPSGTSMEVINPDLLSDDEDEKHQILLKTDNGEILVYLITNESKERDSILNESTLDNLEEEILKKLVQNA